jgi:hypothetical protein
MAGVDPTFVKFNGEDPAAYIVSGNLRRRRLTAGQQAMALAAINPGGSGKGANPTVTAAIIERTRRRKCTRNTHQSEIRPPMTPLSPMSPSPSMYVRAPRLPTKAA